jgi:hypothetical protein
MHRELLRHLRIRDARRAVDADDTGGGPCSWGNQRVSTPDVRGSNITEV